MRMTNGSSVARRWLYAGLLGGALVSLAACQSKTETDPRTLAPLVRTVVVGEGGVASDRLTGVIKARTEADLGFRAPGKIAKRLVDPGQAVKKGQALMALDPQDLELALSAAEAQAERAQADERRLRGLVQTGAVSQQTYDQVKAGATAAVAQRDLARRQRQFATLQADADGVIMTLVADVGQVVAAGQPVLRLAHNGGREAAVDVPENLRSALPKRAKAVLATASDTSVDASLRQIASAADPLTHTFEARYVLEGAGERAPLGATVTGTLSRARGSSVVTVPLSAVVDKGQGATVFVVDAQNVAHRRPVVVQSLEDESAKVSQGLQSGDRIVSLGAALLHDGQAIRLEPRP